ERWKQSLATGEDFEMVFPLRGADGVFRPFLTRIIAVKDERGEIVRWFGTNVDITEQRAIEEALRVANQVKEEFLSVASHELRTPLTSIMPNVQLAARQLRALLHSLAGVEDETQTSQEDIRQLEQRVRRPLQLIENTERQVKRLSRLVDDLLDVSRIQTGKLELRLESCDLLDIARETVHEQRAAWPGRRITLDLPRRTALAIHCDADRIGQALTNYLTNALKYSPEDQPIAVWVRTQEQMARVEVRDHGPGLTEEQRKRLFERFYRAPGIEQQSGSGIGLGLGLYICQSLIERHGGQVGVESAPGEGSTFWFAVPLLTGDAADDMACSAPR
ncbi:MAG TPA: PAS domain-containing sensor histidine kinase, partial [Ktedonobacterales bacterium]